MHNKTRTSHFLLQLSITEQRWWWVGVLFVRSVLLTLLSTPVWACTLETGPGSTSLVFSCWTSGSMFQINSRYSALATNPWLREQKVKMLNLTTILTQSFVLEITWELWILLVNVKNYPFLIPNYLKIYLEQRMHSNAAHFSDCFTKCQFELSF